MTQYACVACCQPAPPGAYDCTCGGALAEVLEPGAPPGIRDDQRIAICQHFKYRGIYHKATRMRRLSEIAGRAIRDYQDLTETEATRAVTDLGRWAHGVRRQEP